MGICGCFDNKDIKERKKQTGQYNRNEFLSHIHHLMFDGRLPIFCG